MHPPHDSIAPELKDIGSLDSPAVLRRLNTGEHGLSVEEVERRRREFGENRVAHEKQARLLRQLLGRLLNPLVVLLVVLAVLSVVMQDQESAIIIVVMVFLSISLDLIQERRSAVGKFEEPLPVLGRPGKRPLEVAEEFRFDQAGAQGGQTDRQE